MLYLTNRLVDAYQKQMLDAGRDPQDPEFAQVIKPPLFDRLKLLLGEALISLGCKIRSASAYSRLSNECL